MLCVYVYTQRYDRVYILGDGDISLFVCFFLLCVSSAILEKCGWIHLSVEAWLLRCDAPHHHCLYIVYIHPENQNLDS